MKTNLEEDSSSMGLDSLQPTVNEELISWSDLSSCMSSSFLPKQNSSFDMPLEPDSLKDHVKTCEANLRKIVLALENISGSVKISKNDIMNIVLLCGEHSKEELWTSPQTLRYAEQLLRIVLLRSNCCSLQKLLLYFKVDSFLIELRPKLMKSTWKMHPAAVECFIWILFSIKCPDLGDIINSVLPTSLLFVDDHVYSNKVKGLHCLQHIATNVSRAELNQYGRGSVIYSAVEHMVYLREAELIPPLAACLTALLSKTERKTTVNTASWSHFDDVLNIWLSSMEMEQKLSLREAYCDSLIGLLEAMGLASVRWSKKLLSIISEYSGQDHTRNKALLILQKFIQTTWPRLSSNFQPIVVILMKIVIKISGHMSDSISKKTLKLVKQCFDLLEKLCNEEYKLFLNDIKSCGHMKDCYILITDCQGEDNIV